MSNMSTNQLDILRISLILKNYLLLENTIVMSLEVYSNTFFSHWFPYVYMFKATKLSCLNQKYKETYE